MGFSKEDQWKNSALEEPCIVGSFIFGGQQQFRNIIILASSSYDVATGSDSSILKLVEHGAILLDCLQDVGVRSAKE
jgi:hypothetical protein